MSVKRFNCVTLSLSNTLFTYVLKLLNQGVRCYQRLSREQFIQQKYKTLKELKKGTPHKDFASLFGVLKIPCQHEEKNKDKIFERYNSGLISKRVKPEKYEQLNKAMHKWFLVLRSENVPVSLPMLQGTLWIHRTMLNWSYMQKIAKK